MVKSCIFKWQWIIILYNIYAKFVHFFGACLLGPTFPKKEVLHKIRRLDFALASDLSHTCLLLFRPSSLSHTFISIINYLSYYFQLGARLNNTFVFIIFYCFWNSFVKFDQFYSILFNFFFQFYLRFSKPFKHNFKK
jgi:hypothetical protein